MRTVSGRSEVKALYRRPIGWLFRAFGQPEPPPEVVEVLGWEGDYARVIVPVSENSILGILAKRDGLPHPRSIEQLVLRSAIEVLEA
jgi:hypothetical protein